MEHIRERVLELVMKVGDLVRMKIGKNWPNGGKLYLVTKVYDVGGLVSLCAFPTNQVFREDALEVVSENR